MNFNYQSIVKHVSTDGRCIVRLLFIIPVMLLVFFLVPSVHAHGHISDNLARMVRKDLNQTAKQWDSKSIPPIVMTVIEKTIHQKTLTHKEMEDAQQYIISPVSKSAAGSHNFFANMLTSALVVQTGSPEEASVFAKSTGNIPFIFYILATKSHMERQMNDVSWTNALTQTLVFNLASNMTKQLTKSNNQLGYANVSRLLILLTRLPSTSQSDHFIIRYPFEPYSMIALLGSTNPDMFHAKGNMDLKAGNQIAKDTPALLWYYRHIVQPSGLSQSFIKRLRQKYNYYRDVLAKLEKKKEKKKGHQ